MSVTIENNKPSMFELMPIDGRKSFYGKCYVIYDDNTYTLYSYTTRIAEYNTLTGIFVKYWPGYSATTMRHINAFMAFINYPNLGGKSWWDMLDCYHFYNLDNFN